MKVHFAVFYSWLLVVLGATITVSAQPPSPRRLQVRVQEQDTRLPIPGSVVLKNNGVYIADSLGYCLIPYDGSGRLTLSVRSFGFTEIKNHSFTVKKEPLVISMTPVVNKLGEVQVTGKRKEKRTEVFQQVSTIESKDLEQKQSLSLAQLLETLPGVSSISTGNVVVKPVIQGMHSSRILIVNDGVRLESQNWGIDHAPEVDHTAVSVIEVIKGAESIRYGYGALGGVVLMTQAKLPYGHEKLKVRSKVNVGAASNSRSYDGSATVEAGYKEFGLRLHGMYKKAGDYSTAKYLLNNTGHNTVSLSGLLGHKSKKIELNLAASLFYSRSGLYYGCKISDIDQLMTRFAIGRPDESTILPFSYNIEPPFQQSQHVTFKGDLTWHITDNHNILFRASYQENLRQEFENRKKDSYSWLPVQDLRLVTHNAEAIWSGDWGAGMNSQAGLSYMYQYNYNVPGTKQPAFIPNFAALTTGIFAIHKMTFGNLVCSAGMRYDMRGLDVKGYTSLSKFKYYNAFKVYSNFTANAAAHYQFNDNFDARINIGWSWRPPDVNELYANGLQHGTYWVEGNNSLESERGVKAVMGGRYRNHWLSIEPSIFYQNVTNYIYDNIGTGVNRFHNHPSGKYPKFIYGQDNVRLTGGDLVATVMPITDLKVTVKGEWIRGRNLTQANWLPFMPSDRYGLGGEYQVSFGSNDKWHASLALDGQYVTKQIHFDPIKDLVPETPPAYFLLGGTATISTKLPHNQHIKVLFIGDNILNNEYKEYTDRFRYYAHARGAQFTLRTIYAF